MWAERFALFQEKPLWAKSRALFREKPLWDESRALFREKLYGEISAIRVVKRKDSSVKCIFFLFYTLFLRKGDWMDRERLASLYQRRYNMIRTLKEETDELLMAVERQDNLSTGLLLDLREESVQNLEKNDMEIRLIVEENRESAAIFRRIMEVEEKDIASLPFPENKIADLAMKIRKALDEIRKNNERMEFHAKRRKDYYEEKILA